MFTRSSRGGGPQNFGAGRGSNNPGFPMGNNTYNQQGNFQSNIAPKSGGTPMNENYKQPQQQNTNQQVQSTQNKQQLPQPNQKPLVQQQQMKPMNPQPGSQVQAGQNKQLPQSNQKPPGQQQQMKPMNQQPGLNQGQQQPQQPAARLKPILKQSAPQNNSQAAVTASQPPSTTTAVPAAPTTPTTITPPTAADPALEEFDDAKDVEMVPPTETEGQPRWKRLKVPGVKVNRKLKRLRMNQRLRKTLMPKNAIMVLNEMKAGVRFNLVENQSLPSSMFLVHAELDGKTYVGQGLSKPLARQNAAENALKGLLLEKMNAASKKMIKMEEDGGDMNNQIITMNIEEDSESTGNVTPTPMETNVDPDETDEIPWSSLASFALYKLFLEWQNQGTVVPMPRPGIQQAAKLKTETRSPPEKKLPPNPWTVHPVMLLNQMRPGSTYLEVNRRGNPPNTVFTLSVEIDGQSYCGEAKNKKDAKKMAAKNALKAVFNVDYPENNLDDSANNQQMQPQVHQLS